MQLQLITNYQISPFFVLDSFILFLMILTFYIKNITLSSPPTPPTPGPTPISSSPLTSTTLLPNLLRGEEVEVAPGIKFYI